MILHIPHSSINTLGRKINKTDINHLTDFYTDELFSHPNADRVVFDLSRFIVDVERFPDDIEPMFKIGQGICYTKGTRNNNIKVIDKENLIENFYKKHHVKLNKLVAKTLCYFPIVVVVDCHSFPPKHNSPDFCLGFNEDVSHDFLKELYKIEKILIDLNFNVSLNSPYKGAIVPTNYINDDRVESIMIEVNKDLYINKTDKNEEFDKIKKVISSILEIIANFEILQK
jgi:N-formylglutamate amidohydrolase